MTEGATSSFASGLLFEYIALTNVLDRDVVASRSALVEHDTQFNRRQFVRTVVADIEGTVGSMIRIALRMHHAGADPFTAGEYALLHERVLELRAPDAVYEPAAKLTTKSNIRFAFSIFTRAVQSDYVLPADESQWSPLLRALDVRDRITLPKSAHDLDISDDELRIVHEADVWFDERCADATKHTRYKAQPERSA